MSTLPLSVTALQPQQCASWK